MKFENVRVMNFANAFRGMRNPKESYHLIDSMFGLDDIDWGCKHDKVIEAWEKFYGLTLLSEITGEMADAECGAWHNYQVIYQWLVKNGVLYREDPYMEVAYLGPKDLKLAQTLINAGPEHRKFMRQIFVSVDITAPLYW